MFNITDVECMEIKGVAENIARGLASHHSVAVIEHVLRNVQARNAGLLKDILETQLPVALTTEQAAAGVVARVVYLSGTALGAGSDALFDTAAEAHLAIKREERIEAVKRIFRVHDMDDNDEAAKEIIAELAVMFKVRP
jgi:hypothetical protein